MNAEKIHPSSLSCSARRARELKAKVAKVAIEIEYGGRNVLGDTPTLARELDRRKIRPLTKSWYPGHGHGKWFHQEYRAQRLVNFLSTHMAELYERGYAALLQSVESQPVKLSVIPITLYPMTVARRELGIPGVTHEMVRDNLVRDSPVREVRDLGVRDNEASQNVLGWSIRKNAKGYYMAYRKIGGLLKSVHIGRDVTQAADKISAWTKKHQATQGTE